MTTQLTLHHTHGDRVTVTSADTEIFAYVYRPDPDPFESRKPYAHPLRTLSGRTITGYRPSDHRWHKGLQLTASHLSGQNFWGGNSYVHGQGYQRIPERVGSMRHDGFSGVKAEGDRVGLAENLTWLHHGGEEWAREEREITLHSVDPGAGIWALDWRLRLTNTRAETLRFGSPTTAGRERAGYTGLHWRGPRDFTGGQVLTPVGPSSDDEMMGTPAVEVPWIGFVAEHDDVDAHSTVVFAHAPENLGEAAIHPSHWFVRSTPTPTVAFSWAFFEEFALPAGEHFQFRYRVLVADGAWDSDRVTAHLDTLSW